MSNSIEKADMTEAWNLAALADRGPSWRQLCGLPEPSEPQPPRRAWIKYPNGRTIECPLKYLGYKKFRTDDHYPNYGWQMLNEGPFDGRKGDTIDVDWTGATMPCYVQCPGTGTPDDHDQP